MKTTLRLIVVSAFVALISIPAALAQVGTPEYSLLPVTEPLDVGGTILQPGEYTIRLINTVDNRNKVQITSTDLKKVYATVLTVPHALGPNETMPNTMFVYFPGGEGTPAALRTWYAPNPDASQGGHDIVYEESRARQLARLSKNPVVFYPATTTEVAETTPLSVVTPEATVETYTYTPPAPPVAEAAPAPAMTPMTSAAPETHTQVAEATEMPRTASTLPLLALLGLMSLVGAFAVRLIRS